METQLDSMPNPPYPVGSSIRVSPEMRNKLDRLKATIFLEEGKKLSMEELIALLYDAYQENKKRKH